jgi:hypothetical protein
MKKKTFKAVLMSGHKDDALEVPFNPTEAWGIDPVPLWRGRRGHNVRGKINGHYFESSIVPRQKKFYLIVDKDIERETSLVDGQIVSVTLEPLLIKAEN